MEFRPPRERERGAVGDLVAAHCGAARASELGTLDCVIAVERHTPVGALHYRIDGDVAEIVYIATVPKRRGTGRRLLAAGCRLLASQGARRVRATADGGDERARQFWSACGFAESRDPAGFTVHERAIGPV